MNPLLPFFRRAPLFSRAPSARAGASGRDDVGAPEAAAAQRGGAASARRAALRPRRAAQRPHLLRMRARPARAKVGRGAGVAASGVDAHARLHSRRPDHLRAERANVGGEAQEGGKGGE
eukprot:2284161-Pleurochrysis_carterae.AAC.2